MTRITRGQRDESKSVVGRLDSRRIPFTPIKFFKLGGAQRRAVVLWLGLCLLAIPSGMLTRMFEWSGMAFEMGGNTIHLTLYLPMIICVPIVLLYGYWWAAIPAYLSTFFVAMLGGMPIPWAIMFSFANPLGLAVFLNLYRVTEFKTDMRSAYCIAGFGVISLIATITGSVGAFVWTHASNVNLSLLYPIWQGWWLGGWLQNLAIVIPLMWLTAPKIDQWLDSIRTYQPGTQSLHKKALPSMLVTVAILLAYVFAARHFALQQFENVVSSVSDSVLQDQMLNTVDGLSYPLYILILLLLAVSFFGYKAISFWSARLQKLNHQLESRNEQLEKLATTDALSGIFNRRKVLETIQNEFVRAHRVSTEMSILMVDADHFKRVNDEHGHLAGDDVIRLLAARLSNCLREYDVLGRYGGEEFIVMLPETGIEQGYAVGERFRQAVELTPMETSAGLINITISVGLASIHRTDEHYTNIIERADRAMYQAKEAGRNRIEADQTMVGGILGEEALKLLCTTGQ